MIPYKIGFPGKEYQYPYSIRRASTSTRYSVKRRHDEVQYSSLSSYSHGGFSKWWWKSALKYWMYVLRTVDPVGLDIVCILQVHTISEPPPRIQLNTVRSASTVPFYLYLPSLSSEPGWSSYEYGRTLVL